MPLFNRPRLPAEEVELLTEVYREQLGRRPGRLLAVARTTSGWCALLADRLAYRDDRGWHLVGWHEIDRGGWNSQNDELRWELADNRVGSVLIEEAGRVPDVFNERVHASIVVQRHVEIPGTREGGVVSARRDPGCQDASLVWRARRGRGTPGTAEVMEALEAQLVRLRADYDI